MARLVERVSSAIDGRINPDQWLHMEAARAAIREVATWLREQPTFGVALTCRDFAALLEWETDQ